MSRIDIVVMDHGIRTTPSRFSEQPSQRLALAQVKVERRRDYESLLPVFDRQIFQRCELHFRMEAQNRRARSAYLFNLGRSRCPSQGLRRKVAGDYESRHTAPIR